MSKFTAHVVTFDSHGVPRHKSQLTGAATNFMMGRALPTGAVDDPHWTKLVITINRKVEK